MDGKTDNNIESKITGLTTVILIPILITLILQNLQKMRVIVALIAFASTTLCEII
jgi:hypothetical protein